MGGTQGNGDPSTATLGLYVHLYHMIFLVFEASSPFSVMTLRISSRLVGEMISETT